MTLREPQKTGTRAKQINIGERLRNIWIIESLSLYLHGKIKAMKRFIIKYPNGKIRQQEGINGTYHTLLGMQVISWEVMFGNKDESVITEKISSYDDSNLIISED